METNRIRGIKRGSLSKVRGEKCVYSGMTGGDLGFKECMYISSRFNCSWKLKTKYLKLISYFSKPKEKLEKRTNIFSGIKSAVKVNQRVKRYQAGLACRQNYGEGRMCLWCRKIDRKSALSYCNAVLFYPLLLIYLWIYFFIPLLRIELLAVARHWRYNCKPVLHPVFRLLTV